MDFDFTRTSPARQPWMANPRSLRRPLLLLSAALVADAFPLPDGIRLRPGFPDDVVPISLALAKELMNPLGISHENSLLVAEDAETGERVGWAQIRSLGYAGVAADPSRFEDDGDGGGGSLARREVQPRSSIEDDANELLWQDFDDDPVDFPNGLASLPWTAEYRAASRAADERLRRRERLLARELARRPRLWELSSVYVVPARRRAGIGRTLVRRALERHRMTHRPGNEVYALTLTKTLPWYEALGFAREADVPNAMAMEMGVGRAVTTALGEELVCIRAKGEASR